MGYTLHYQTLAKEIEKMDLEALRENQKNKNINPKVKKKDSRISNGNKRLVNSENNDGKNETNKEKYKLKKCKKAAGIVINSNLYEEKSVKRNIKQMKERFDYLRQYRQTYHCLICSSKGLKNIKKITNSVLKMVKKS